MSKEVKKKIEVKETLHQVGIYGTLRYLKISKLNSLKKKLKSFFFERSLARILSDVHAFSKSSFNIYEEKVKDNLAGVSLFGENIVVITSSAGILTMYIIYNNNGELYFKEISKMHISEFNIAYFSNRLDNENILVNYSKTNSTQFSIQIIQVNKLKSKMTLVKEFEISRVVSCASIFKLKENNIESSYLSIGMTNGFMYIYSIEKDYKELIKFEDMHSLSIVNIVLHSQDRYLITASKDSRMFVINTSDFKLSNFQFKTEHSLSIMFMCVNDNTIITGGIERLIKVWTVNSKSSIQTMKCFDNMAFCFKFFPLYGFLVSGDCSKRVFINNFYSDDFEVIKKIPCGIGDDKENHIAPHFFDCSQGLDIIVCADKYKNKLVVLYTKY